MARRVSVVSIATSLSERNLKESRRSPNSRESQTPRFISIDERTSSSDWLIAESERPKKDRTRSERSLAKPLTLTSAEIDRLRLAHSDLLNQSREMATHAASNRVDVPDQAVPLPRPMRCSVANFASLLIHAGIEIVPLNTLNRLIKRCVASSTAAATQGCYVSQKTPTVHQWMNNTNWSSCELTFDVLQQVADLCKRYHLPSTAERNVGDSETMSHRTGRSASSERSQLDVGRATCDSLLHQRSQETKAWQALTHANSEGEAAISMELLATIEASTGVNFDHVLRQGNRDGTDTQTVVTLEDLLVGMSTAQSPAPERASPALSPKAHAKATGRLNIATTPVQAPDRMSDVGSFIASECGSTESSASGRSSDDGRDDTESEGEFEEDAHHNLDRHPSMFNINHCVSAAAERAARRTAVLNHLNQSTSSRPPRDEEPQSEKLKKRLLAVCRQTKEAMTLKHSHMERYWTEAKLTQHAVPDLEEIRCRIAEKRMSKSGKEGQFRAHNSGPVVMTSYGAMPVNVKIGGHTEVLTLAELRRLHEADRTQAELSSATSAVSPSSRAASRMTPRPPSTVRKARVPSRSEQRPSTPLTPRTLSAVESHVARQRCRRKGHVEEWWASLPLPPTMSRAPTRSHQHHPVQPEQRIESSASQERQGTPREEGDDEGVRSVAMANRLL